MSACCYMAHTMHLWPAAAMQTKTLCPRTNSSKWERKRGWEREKEKNGRERERKGKKKRKKEGQRKKSEGVRKKERRKRERKKERGSCYYSYMAIVDR